MNHYRSITLLGLILFCSFCCGAQDNNYVYKDTAVLFADSVEAETKAMEKEKLALYPVENEKEENFEEEFITDTVLINNQLFVEPDSIKALKHSKPFSYAKNLDSMLYAYQQSLESEEDAAKNKISWLERFLLSPVTKYFFWMLAIVFISIILYKLFFTEGFFQRSYAKINVAALPDERGALSKSADYGKLIAKAVSACNYRMAVRYHYLQSLQKLSLKGAIQFAADKTNHQYVNELTGKTYKKAFASLTLHYEYVWYGGFEIDEYVFNAIQNKFKQFNSGV